MNIKILLIYAVLSIFLTSISHGDVISINADGWTIDQVNGIPVAVNRILHENDISRDKIVFDRPNVDVINPSKSISFITSQMILDEYNEWQGELAVLNAIAEQEENKKIAEIESSEFNKINLTQVDNAINNINNLADAKLFLKKLVRYLAAKGVLD